MRKKTLIITATLFLIIDCVLMTIKLSQQRPKPIHKEKPHYKYSIYFTSDDGPLVGSKELNQLVHDYEFPLTLFLVGKPLTEDSTLKSYYEAYKKNRYLLLENHSFSHASFHYKRYYRDSDGVVKDFIKNRDLLDLNTTLIRLPGRNVWYLNNQDCKGESNNSLAAAAKLYKECQYRSFGWDYEIRVNSKRKIILSALKHYKRIKTLLKEGKTYKKGSIVILMHDQLFHNKENLKTLGELVLLFQDDDECKLKFLDQY